LEGSGVGDEWGMLEALCGIALGCLWVIVGYGFLVYRKVILL
jgi:hypothetical protein